MDNNSNPLPNDLPPADTGSLLGGFVLGWVAMIAGVICNALFWMLQTNFNSPSLGFVGLGVAGLPLLTMLALLFWFSSHGKSRAVKGVLLSFASMVGLSVLLMAACFGLIAMNGGLNFH